MSSTTRILAGDPVPVELREVVRGANSVDQRLTQASTRRSTRLLRAAAEDPTGPMVPHGEGQVTGSNHSEN